MIDISDLTLDELIELRYKVNGRIGALKAVEKRKQKPDKRNRTYLFEKYEEAKMFIEKYLDYGLYRWGRSPDLVIKSRYGCYYAVHACNTKDEHNEILSAHNVERLHYKSPGGSNKEYTTERPNYYLVRDTYILKRRDVE